MDFDFYDQYKNYSNVELLKICKQPANFQAAAIDAAKEILKSRNVSEEELRETENYFTAIQTKEQAKKDKINNYKEKAADLLQPVLHPTEEVVPAKWLNIVLLVIIIQYIYTLYLSIRTFKGYIGCSYCHFDVVMILTILGILYTPIAFILLLKRNKWGWMLLFGEKLFAVIGSVLQFYFFYTKPYYYINTSSELFSLVFNTAFVLFLWRENIAALFSVHPKQKKETVIFVVVLMGVLFIGLEMVTPHF